MGCCSSRNFTNQSCESLIQNCEKYLNIHKCKSLDIDRITHRNSYNLLMSKIQFELTCKHLGLNFKDEVFSDFFMQIYKEKKHSYCVRQFSLLGIFLGIGSKEEKAQLLFQNYDLDASNTLTCEEIEYMLKEICKVSFLYLTALALRLTSLEERTLIEKYRNELMNIRDTIVQVFMTQIFEDYTGEITLDEFKKLFEKSHIAILINPSEMRKYSIFLFNKVLDKVQAVKAFINNPELIDKEIRNKLQLNKGEKKKIKITLG
ncbi:hypothetical protein SteCoe_26680 [Stentor coeruleus]|uniref:EF-hand domain-containing protein n=1 Tax=Stentor coeruleus TaxID=5963 RepID=A0A1R2BC95_9CILI|nr:hypothetical protein SteCoe_26680 [Stentor coeruleus]